MNLNDLYKPPPFCGEECTDLKYFEGAIEGVDLSPAYQRGPRWTQEQQEAFMGHLIQGGHVNPIIVQRVPDKGGGEVLDGKQRTLAIFAWLADEVGARLDDGRTIYRRDVSGGLARVELRIKYINLPFEERKRFYVRFNSAGVPHTPEELAAALRAQPKGV